MLQAFHNYFRRKETQLHELNYLFWECTWRCNLNCRHCGSDCTASSVRPDMPFEDFLNAIAPLEKRFKRNSIMVVITGGEPLLRADLADCGRELRKHGFQWSIVSNGYAYDEAMHRRLMDAGLGSITISLDGLRDTHDLFRKRQGSFDRALNAISLIANEKRLPIYDVVTCVSPLNIGQLPEMKELLIEKGVKHWRFFTIAPIGRAATDDGLQLDGPQMRQLMDFIVATRKEGRIDTIFSCEAYTGPYERKVRDWYYFCRAGITIASVLIDGSISACPNINRSFVQGNIYTDNLLDVWENRFEPFRDRSWTKTGVCAQCKEYKNCLGGAMHLHPDITSGITLCHYNKIVESLLLVSDKKS